MLDLHMHRVYLWLMKLNDYLALTKTTEAAFAQKVGVSQPHIGRLRRGQCWPSRQVAQRIFDETDGAVTPDDFLAGAEAA